MSPLAIVLVAVTAVGVGAARRGVRGAGAMLALAFALTFPYLPFVPFSVLGNVNVAAQYALIAASIVVVTGWVGQISLGHAGLVGTGAYVTGLATGGLNIGFPVNMLWGAVAGMAIAVLLGVVALRVRGLYLAVATLIFSWTAEAFLFRQEWFTRHASISLEPIGRPNTIPYFQWNEREVFYYAAWATVAVALLLLANVRDSKTGRSFFAVRGSEVAAASLGIDVMRTKLVAFAISGFVAGAAGSLIMVGNLTVTPDRFRVDQSLFFLSIAVVGGLSSLGGGVAAALLFGFLEEAFFQVEQLAGYLTVVSALLLAVVLLTYRGGLAAIPASLAPRLGPLRRAVDPMIGRVDRGLARLRTRLNWTPKRRGFRPRDSWDEIVARVLAARDHHPQPPEGSAAPETGEQSPPTSAGAGATGGDRTERALLLGASNVTVRFGGLTAVDDASLEVREGEIVGLIGPNGAGKTTLFNAIAGLNEPTSGVIEMFGHDVTQLPVHRRAVLGVGRTFQAIQLFGELTVAANLLVATHQHNPTGLFAHLAATPRSIEAERDARVKVADALAVVGLADVAERRCRDLPFGVLRMVEVARALVTEARLVMLDEPASGLDNNETDRLAELIRRIRQLGVTVLLIEHDVRMVTAVCDHLYVLEQGRIIADGPPATVARDARVIEAYLGRDDSAHDDNHDGEPVPAGVDG